jgi:hypothetical protein
MLYLTMILHEPTQSNAMWEMFSARLSLFTAPELAAYVRRDEIYTETEVDRPGFHQIMIS